MSDQAGLHPDLGTFVSIAPSVVVGFGLERSFALVAAPFSALDATFGVENLADVVAYDQLGLPQPGRTVRLGVRVR
jgi:iron complex outermembrane receptor protein